MHPEILETSQIPCKRCGMALVPQHDHGAFICLEHLDSVDVREGKCATCAKELTPVARGKMYICQRHPQMIMRGDGSCPICKIGYTESAVADVWVCAREATGQGKRPRRGIAQLYLGPGETLEFETHRAAPGENIERLSLDNLDQVLEIAGRGDILGAFIDSADNVFFGNFFRHRDQRKLLPAIAD